VGECLDYLAPGTDLELVCDDSTGTLIPPAGPPPDTAAPETSITSGPSNPTTSRSASFALEASEVDCTFEVRLDGGAWKPASGVPANGAGVTTCSHEETGLSLAAHTLEARASDSAANVDPTPATHPWTVQADFPSIEEVVFSAATSDSLNLTVNLPDTTGDADELLVGIFARVDAAFTSIPGFTILTQEMFNNLAVAVAWRDTDGSEGSSVVATASNTRQGAAQVYRIKGWDGKTAPAWARNTGQSFTTPYTPPVLDPAGWGTEKTLWIASAAFNAAGSITGYPAGYGSTQFVKAGFGVMIGTCSLEAETASQDPGNFTGTGGFGAWRCHTIAVRPAS
jgi:hypothetical protein